MEPLTRQVQAMIPYGLALRAYADGERDAQLVIRRDDGWEARLPVAHFFRERAEFTAIESAALDLCRDPVLDIGAGTGLHSLELRSRGLQVTAIDVSPEAARIMTERGVSDTRCTDLFSFHGGPFRSLLMLGHGIGIVEDEPGLIRFLGHARELTREGGQLLVHSLDVLRTDAREHLAYHDANRRAGRYVGETRIRFEYGGTVGRYCSWLHVAPEILQAHGQAAGWGYETIRQEQTGDYLARLTRSPGR